MSVTINKYGMALTNSKKYLNRYNTAIQTSVKYSKKQQDLSIFSLLISKVCS